MSLRFTIANPCSKKWADLRGEGRERQCDVCHTSVHAIAQYSTEEWDRIWHESDGRVCAFLNGESPAEPRSRRAVLAGALLTAISPLMAQNGRVRIRVLDVNRAMVATAEASIVGVDDKPTKTAHADAVGEIAFTDLPLGDCRFAVAAPGFATRPLTVTIKNGDEVKVEAVLELGFIGETVFVETLVETQSEKMTSTLPAATKPAKRRRWLIFHR